MGIWIFQILQIIKCISSTVSYNWETSGCLTKNPIGIVLKHLASVFFLWDHCTSLISAWSDSPLSKEGPVDVYIYLKYSDMNWRLFFWSNPFLGWKRHGWWGFLGIWDPEKTPGWLSGNKFRDRKSLNITQLQVAELGFLPRWTASNPVQLQPQASPPPPGRKPGSWAENRPLGSQPDSLSDRLLPHLSVLQQRIQIWTSVKWQVITCQTFEVIDQCSRPQIPLVFSSCCFLSPCTFVPLVCPLALTSWQYKEGHVRPWKNTAVHLEPQTCA